MNRWRKMCLAATCPLSLWRARRHLKAVRRQLARHDVRRVLRLPCEKGPNIDPEQAELLYRLAAKGLRRCRCLPQSVALFQYLRSRNIPARHHIGINKNHRYGQKLAAHAWVDFNRRTGCKKNVIMCSKS